MRGFVAGTCLSVLTVCSGVAGAAPLSEGAQLPAGDVAMPSTKGGDVTLGKALKDSEHGLLVMFSCNHCPYVKAWEQRIARIGNAYGKRGFSVVAINSNDPRTFPDDAFEPMKSRATERGFQFDYVVDQKSEVARAFGATRTPEVYVFGKDGKLRYQGAIDDNATDEGSVKRHYLREALDAVIAGKAVKTTETKSVGCGIKFRS